MSEKQRAPARQSHVPTKHEREGALVPKNPLSTVQAWNDFALQAEASDRVNLISPVSAVDHLPSMSQLAVSQVTIDAKVDEYGSGVDCYFDRRFCKGTAKNPGEVAFGKTALFKIMRAAGLNKVDSYRSDDRSSPYFCEWTVVLAGEAIDGRPVQTTRSKTIDFRDGAPETRKPERSCQDHGTRGCSCGYAKFNKTGKTVALADDVLGEKRKNLEALAETKALTAAIREVLALPHKLPVARMRLPFLIPALVPRLDESDPDVKAALIEKRVHGTRELYPSRAAGGRRPALAPPPVGSPTADDERPPEELIVEAEAVGVEPPPPGALAAPPSEEPAKEDPPPPPPLDDEEAPPPRHPGACSCPCGCQEVLEAAQARRSKERTGALRCSECYPSKSFNYERHEKTGKLELPKYPEADVDQVRRWAGVKK